ncbi:hypothetical protein [Bradyrhizobium sp. CER78]|uniref:hypothetical protein n=1 Tax=Bradyrhizobium sp. CER78 TaxID=3039162 RepID=UPI00244CE06C|nr:hypothetical protein [Bradyrhizobium sp. CER78]MDH2383610.1 hypothetical protein [Bradyrhizobium sp. CER78]
MSLDEVRLALAPFLQRNPNTSVAFYPESTDRICVFKAWNDDSIVFQVPTEDAAAFYEAFNNLLFPERFTAIWHSDTKDFEIIYTAFPLTGTQRDMKGRRFTFGFKDVDYTCEFGAASERLLTAAGSAIFTGPSTTEHRNLQSFQWSAFKATGRLESLKDLPLEPISFWIRNFDWDDILAVELVRHLNFYMTYYDTFSPKIDLHPPKQASEYSTRERYVATKFPTDVRAQELNSNLLHFWTASRGGDVFRRFLYCYQIIEFSSFYFIEDGVKRAVRKALLTPHFKDEMDALVIKIIDHVQESKVWEGAKMDTLLGELNCRLVWTEVEKNKDYFAKSLMFDGGFVLPALIHEKTTFETFEHDWNKKFNQVTRSIRNALSHGKEPSKGAVIAPTPENLTQLQPWAWLMSIVAGEVIVYQDSVM